MAIETVNANPDKAFFVDSITKDISLLDCVLDLIDNSIDSVSSHLEQGEVLSKPNCLLGSTISINFSASEFSIKDNGQGITIKDAQETVFRFGSLKKDHTHESIGYYGIGLKRATFKIGHHIIVSSTSKTEKFNVVIDIPDWLSKPNEWTFPLNIIESSKSFDQTGVDIKITQINSEIAESFKAPSFRAKLFEIVARDYYFFLKAGIKITINEDIVNPASFEIKDDSNFRPGRQEYADDGVHVTIVSGCHSKFELENNEDAENFDPKVSGWYVICNNRIILAANKDDKTIWRGKQEGFTFWHPQYNGFVGFVFFNSTDQKKLPWTTTKRYVDLESNVYRKALIKMLDMTKPWIQYTGHRKSNIEVASQTETGAKATSLSALAIKPSNDSIVLPQFPSYQPAEKIDYATISFKVEKFKADKSKSVLGNPAMSNTELGRYAFDYLYKNEIGQ